MRDLSRRKFLLQSASLSALAAGAYASGTFASNGLAAKALAAKELAWPPSSPGGNDALDRRTSWESTATGTEYAIATVHEIASRAAEAVFISGGNAVDAAIAASLMLGVVDPHNSGIGGGCFALIRQPDGTIHAIDGREQAGAAATPDMYLVDGRPDVSRSQTGPLASAIPGQVAALEMLSQRFGQRPWASLVEPSALVAEEGFALGRLAAVIRANATDLAQFPESKRVLLPGGKIPSATDRLHQPDLAKTLRLIATEGGEAFYRGPIAHQIADYMQANGGILTVDDFASYQVKQRQPLRTHYRGYEIVGFPPPSSGGIHVAQMLGMLELFDVLQVFNRDPAAGYHLWLEVMQRAMADRAHWLGDADFVSVPTGLIDPGYLATLAGSIQLGKTSDVASHGLPPGATSQFFGDKHTTHLTTADRDGWVVAITQTINTSFGSKVIVPGTGIVMNNEMDDFSVAPGVANAFGLVGAAANAIAPGKRPLSSMSPTLVLDSAGQPFLTCGAAGGPRIITATMQNVSRVIDLGQTISEAMPAPRVHHQWRPAEAVVEQRLANETIEGLTARGHRVKTIQSSATAQGIQWLNGNQLRTGQQPERNHPLPVMMAAAEPRVSGAAVAR